MTKDLFLEKSCPVFLLPSMKWEHEQPAAFGVTVSVYHHPDVIFRMFEHWPESWTFRKRTEAEASMLPQIELENVGNGPDTIESDVRRTETD